MQTEVSSDAWRKLFLAASAFRTAAPWEWVSDSQLFGVVDPETGERCYCSVMGGLGDYFALGVYPGSEGFRSYHMLFSDDVDEDPNESLYYQRCMVGAFEDEGELDEDDKILARSLELNFDGDRQWPNFRSYRPGFMPWAMDAAEVNLMTIAYEQALIVTYQIKEDSAAFPSYNPAEPGKVSFRKLVGDAWTDVKLEPDSPVALSPAQLQYDAEKLKKAVSNWEKSQGIWLMEMFFLDKPVMEEEDERPYFPKAAVFMDMKDGRILGLDAIKPQEVETATLDTMLELFDHFGALPETIVVSNRANYILLKGFCRLAGIDLELDEKLDVVDDLRNEIFGNMGNRE
ncbi:MAG TPA: hypothetical protein ENJ82_14700 [Bacteroidetes bacterium]|nr:hypothetical protein [Bacteroidota bacterium]